ncbi:MAG: C1 family peptidase [Desulfobacteraceae bacterium]|nr:C1 family peptidase [Desulfobacteraceae bacterium]
MGDIYPVTQDKYRLNAIPDIPDIRDLVYQPALIPLKDEISPPEDLVILDQGRDGACTGFGLAACINFLYQRKEKTLRVSPWMLYEMARKFDEWEGEQYSGSSCRGAIRGWQNMGVCLEELWPHGNGDRGGLTVERAGNAGNTMPGAYYRLSSRVEDFHAALNEVGVLFVSAKVHRGWHKANISRGRILHMDEPTGGHAFAIVGYGSEGFYVQNSWGGKWGYEGLALWSYEDWQQNLVDAWVVRLAVPTPRLWTSRRCQFPTREEGAKAAMFRGARSPRRHEIRGHFVHMDDGRFHTKGRYFSSLADVAETAGVLSSRDKYSHLLLYAHGGLNSPKSSAKRIAAMKSTFKSNGIYPYHFMYDTGLMEELKDIVFRREPESKDRSQGLWNAMPQAWDRWLERSVRVPGRALWREMKQGASSPFKEGNAGSRTLETLVGSLPENVKLHVAGHSTGAILLVHLLQRLKIIRPSLTIATASLMAPACTVDDFKTCFAPLLSANGKGYGIRGMVIYNLTDELEQADTVVKVYGKSLLYLVSRAFEEERETPLLGMQRHCTGIKQDRLTLLYSRGDRGKQSRCLSREHGGFDNDPATMNDILKRILGPSTEPMAWFTEKSLEY